jgi:hypothetical protein
MNKFSGGGHTNLVSQWKSIENILYYNQYISVKFLTLKFKFQVKSPDPPPPPHTSDASLRPSAQPARSDFHAKTIFKLKILPKKFSNDSQNTKMFASSSKDFILSRICTLQNFVLRLLPVGIRP